MRQLAAIFVVYVIVQFALAFVPAAASDATLDARLLAAVSSNDMTAVQETIGQGADPFVLDDGGLAAVDVAVDLGYFDIAHYLLAAQSQQSAARRVQTNVQLNAASEGSELQLSPSPTPPLNSVPSSRPLPPEMVETGPGSIQPAPPPRKVVAPQTVQLITEAKIVPEITPVQAISDVAQDDAVSSSIKQAKRQNSAAEKGVPVEPPIADESSFFDTMLDFISSANNVENEIQGASKQAAVPLAVKPKSRKLRRAEPLPVKPEVQKTRVSAARTKPSFSQTVVRYEETPKDIPVSAVEKRPIEPTLAPLKPAADITPEVMPGDVRISAREVGSSSVSEFKQRPTSFFDQVTEFFRRAQDDPASSSEMTPMVKPVLRSVVKPMVNAVASEKPMTPVLVKASPTPAEPSIASLLEPPEVANTTAQSRPQRAPVHVPEPKIKSPASEIYAVQGRAVPLAFGKDGWIGKPLDPRKTEDGNCIVKRSVKSAFCVENIDWPDEIRSVFSTASYYAGAGRAIVRYDESPGGAEASQFHVLFPTRSFARLSAYFKSTLGPPSEIPEIWTAMLGEPKRFNKTLRWRSAIEKGDGFQIVEMREIDDLRWSAPPDIKHGVVRMYRDGARPIFQSLSTADLLLLQVRKGVHNRELPPELVKDLSPKG